MILHSHPTTNANVRQAALSFAEAGLLGEFWTCVSWDPASPLNRLLPARARSLLARRALPEAVRPYAHLYPWHEGGRLLASALGLRSLLAHEKGRFSVDAVYQALDLHLARRIERGAKAGLSAVYASEDGAASLFTAAKKAGLKRLYDLPIGYWRAARTIYAEEVEREPEWAATMTGIQDSAQKLARKDTELELAETVLVASSFTRETLEQAPNRPRSIHVIPYGAPPTAAQPPGPPPAGKLRVLFVGSLGQRKGLSYLLEAVNLLPGGVELTLLGQRTVEGCAPLDEALRRHRWIRSLPHHGVLQEMAAHDVFVFPSLFEGFGLVILEAMAQGIPVITTRHTAGPDVITEGVDGFIVPIRSAEAIAEKLDLLRQDPSLLSAMKAAALRSAAGRKWSEYRRRLAESVRSELLPLISP